jgi:hypothetical protein
MAKRANKWKVIALIALSFLVTILTFGVVRGVFGFTGNIGDDRKQVAATAISWEIGNLDAAGKETDGDTSCVRTKNYIALDNLDVDLEKDPTVKYRVVLFDEDKNFLAEIEQTDDFDEKEIPEEHKEAAAYCKIVVLPNADAEVSATEIQGYISQLEITVDKKAA